MKSAAKLQLALFLRLSGLKRPRNSCTIIVKFFDAYLNSIIIPYHLVVCTDVYCTGHMSEIEPLYCSIVNAILIARRNAIPHSKPHRTNHIPNWRNKIEPLKEMTLFWHNEYWERGRPDSGFYFEMCKYSRKVNHAKRRGHYKTAYVQKMTNIARCFTEKKMSNLWTMVSKIIRAKQSTACQMDGHTNETDILQIFSVKYNLIYNSVRYDCIAMENILADNENDIKHMCSIISNHISKCHLHMFDKDMIAKDVFDMETGKSDGLDGLSSDYFKHGTDLLFVYFILSCLFNCILIHGFIPNSLCVSTLLHIPINQLTSLSDSNNYRAIALSSLFGKIMDACIINKQCQVLKFHDFLFAYKPNHSTVQCVSTIKEVISYYNINKSPAYMCMLDASKAFDKVNLLKGMCPLLLRFIINMYIGQNIRVKWNDCISHVYAASNGVKQGGVMSPLLFNLYVQDLIECLDRKGVGCHIGNHFFWMFHLCR